MFSYLKPSVCIILFTVFIFTAGKTQVIDKNLLDSIYALKQLPKNQIVNDSPLFTTSTLPTLHKGNALPTLPSLANRIISSICYDTSARFFLQTDSVSYYMNDNYLTSDGHVLISGQWVNWRAFNRAKGFVLKSDLDGNVQWFKLYDTLNGIKYNLFNYSRVIELSDRSLFLAGHTNNQVSGNQDLLLTRTDAVGNIIWSKVYKSRLWQFGGSGSLDYFYVQQMKQDSSTGDIFITGPFWTAGKGVIRINATNGNIVWAKAYSQGGNFDAPFGLDIKPNELRLIGRSDVNGISYTRINKLTGDTIQIKYFRSKDTVNNKLGFLGKDPLRVLNNGHYILSGSSYGNFQYQWNGLTPFYQASVAEFDSNFNFIRAFNFSNFIEGNSYNTRVTVAPDGSGIFTMLHYISSYTANVYYIQFRDAQILKQRVINYKLGLPKENDAMQISGGGTLLVRVAGDSSVNIGKIEFLKMHLSDTSSSCIGRTDLSTSLVPYVIEPGYGYCDSVRSNVFQENPNKALLVTDSIATRAPACFQISLCDSLKLVTSSNTTCIMQPINIVCRKSKTCGNNPYWQYDTSAVNNFTQVNDTTFSISFKRKWSGFVYGTMQGCALLKDSVYIDVLESPAFVNLGPDTSICPANSITLNAHTGFASYNWQDGSTDSIFMVTAPGKYYVQVTNGCSGVMSDTVNITADQPVIVNAGIDRIKCNNDTIHLNAPPGFVSYQWSPAYNITSLSSQQTVVNPLIDTSYILRVEKKPGCFGFDTLKINVFQSPPIQLPNDTSLCRGDSLWLDVGAGFSNYSWSNGSSSQRINIKQAGQYRVVATTLQNCHSTDTFNLVNLYNLPAVSLNHTAELCKGTQRILDAGNYRSFLWNDGSTGRTFTATGTGLYYVVVTDNHGCKGTDTVNITNIIPLPSAFLGPDTAICSYDKIVLQTNQSFARYLWSSGENGSTITITKPGMYSLRVTNNNSCEGSDTIIVKEKQCMKGLYVPSAFTPNNDGKNEEFKAMLFGKIVQFRLEVFNRFGEIVFSTNDPAKGWNGQVKGIPQNMFAFVWKCTYQLEGEPLQTAKGTLVLIR